MTGLPGIRNASGIPIDLASLESWMDDRGVGAGPITEVRLLTGGTQNVLLRFRRGMAGYVLRRPPVNPRPQSYKTLLREADLLGALSQTRVPHPRLVARCDDAVVLGAPFMLLAAVDGFNPTVGLAEAARRDAGIRRRMGLELIDGLAALAEASAPAIGLGDFGRMEGFLERQADRWLRELSGYTRYADWSGPADLGPLQPIRDWLATRCPRYARPGIIHGDYHIGNMIYRDDGALAAIVDWEMATLGDPLMDLGRLLATWPGDDECETFVMRVQPLAGFPTRAELVEHYARTTGRDLSDLIWFEVVSCYKLAILLEGSYARAQAGLTDMATGMRLHVTAKGLLQRARARLEAA